ncbi:MAG TPA: carboxypeptidase-like regulatory domain-containing protein [Bacteroidales bacterium]|nr:carboxypeptidase-like regulatory domain-containing protein [Bacteroidales bacterium]
MNKIFLSITLIIVLLVTMICSIFAEPITGKIIIENSNQPAEYVNVGLMGKGIGTVSDQYGNFSIEIPASYDEELLYFTRVGYANYSIKVSELRNQKNLVIKLQALRVSLNEVSVIPKEYKKRTLGVTTKSKSVSAGFNNYKLGYELGLLMKINKPTYIQKVHVNFAACTYDSIFVRLNIYKKVGDMGFVNILTEPIYINLPKKDLNQTVTIDLVSKYIRVEDDFLITLENVRDMGNGELMFCASLISQATYFRETSQAKWEKMPAPIGISISAEVETEK